MAAGTIFGEDIEDVTEDTFESQKDSKVQKIKSNTLSLHSGHIHEFSPGITGLYRGGGGHVWGYAVIINTYRPIRYQ